MPSNAPWLWQRFSWLNACRTYTHSLAVDAFATSHYTHHQLHSGCHPARSTCWAHQLRADSLKNSSDYSSDSFSIPLGALLSNFLMWTVYSSSRASGWLLVGHTVNRTAHDKEAKARWKQSWTTLQQSQAWAYEALSEYSQQSWLWLYEGTGTTRQGRSANRGVSKV